MKSLLYTALLSTMLASPAASRQWYLFEGEESPFQQDTNQLKDQTSLNRDDRSDHWRPQIHFSPLRNWMNDPNGLFQDSKGVWHMYYQYAEQSGAADNIVKNWGHATSTDLYNWVDKPIAIFGTAADGSIWSGSVMMDNNNTSDLFPKSGANGEDNVIAYYTSWEPDQQSQHLAFSSDGGNTFSQYAMNPIISLSRHGFRDPKVSFHHETQKWVMALSLENAVTFYTSSNLRDWSQVSIWDPQQNLGMIECPQFLQIPRKDSSGTIVGSKWVLTLSLGGGGVTGGAAVRYVVGSFDGTVFTPDKTGSLKTRQTRPSKQDMFTKDVDYTTHEYDFGPDKYATAFFHLGGSDDANKDAYSVSWAVDATAYGCCTPTDRNGWRHVMSGVRRHWLDADTNRLVSVPAGDTAHLVSTNSGWNPIVDEKGISGLEGTSSVIRDYNPAVEWTLIARVQRSLLKNNASASATLSFQNKKDERVSLRFDFSTPSTSRSGLPVATFSMSRSGLLAWDRSGTYEAPDIEALQTSSAQADSDEVEFTLHGILDRSILEVYVNGGIEAGTMIYFAEGTLDNIVLARGTTAADKGLRFDFKAVALRSSWHTYDESRLRGGNADSWSVSEL